MTVHIVFDQDRRVTDLFELQWGRLAGTGERVLRKTARNGAAQRLVHAEVNAGNLLSALDDGGYPPQLARVVEHDLTGPRPHVTTTYRGEPVAGQPGVPLPETVLTIFGDLLTAIGTLAKAGLTHGAILPEFVLWDGAHAQLVNLGEAVAVGEPAGAALDPVWQPPPGPDGLRLAGQAHEVYQAGMVIYCIAGRAPAADAASVRAALARDGSALGALLDGVFADDPRDRPDVHRLLQRVEEARQAAVWRSGEESDATVRIPQQYAPPPAAPLTPARQEFRRLVAAKRQYRLERGAPQRVAWRYLRGLFDVLWYSRDEPVSRILLGAGALVVVGLPVLLVVLAAARFGGS